MAQKGREVKKLNIAAFSFPFNGPEIDVPGTMEHLLQIASYEGVSGIVCNGTTAAGHERGYGPKLKHIEALGRAKQRGLLRADLQIIFATGTTDLIEVQDLTWAAKDAGLDGVLALLPTEHMAARVLVQSLALTASSGNCQIGVHLYDMPQDPLNLPIEPNFLTEIEGFKQIRGVKTSTDRWDVLREWIFVCREIGRHVYVGHDDFASVGMRMGAAGVTSGTGNTLVGIESLLALMAVVTIL